MVWLNITHTNGVSVILGSKQVYCLVNPNHVHQNMVPLLKHCTQALYSTLPGPQLNDQLCGRVAHIRFSPVKTSGGYKDGSSARLSYISSWGPLGISPNLQHCGLIGVADMVTSSLEFARRLFLCAVKIGNVNRRSTCYARRHVSPLIDPGYTGETTMF